MKVITIQCLRLYIMIKILVVFLYHMYLTVEIYSPINKYIT